LHKRVYLDHHVRIAHVSQTRLPSLNGLRAFEAAARHGSLTRAAGELHVTHSAISHQISALEADLGVALFRRVGRGIEVSSVGLELEAALTDAFARIARAVQRVRNADRAGILTLSVEPSFAARWLVLRLGRFGAAHPEIDLRLAATSALADFAREDVDMAIRHGRGPWAGLAATRLMAARMFPVGSPALVGSAASPLTPAALASFTLIHEGDEQDWAEWLAAAGVSGADASRGPRFDDGNLALAAAISGQGIALADEALAGDALVDGRLRRLSAVEIATDKAYWLVHPPEAAQLPKVAAFREWLLREVAGQLSH
jgi:LysR family glycine cleavage system transcriptional activator